MAHIPHRKQRRRRCQVTNSFTSTLWVPDLITFAVLVTILFLPTHAEAAYSIARGEAYDNETYVAIVLKSVNYKDFFGVNQKAWPFLNQLCRVNSYLTAWHPTREYSFRQLEEWRLRRAIILPPSNPSSNSGGGGGAVITTVAPAVTTTSARTTTATTSTTTGVTTTDGTGTPTTGAETTTGATTTTSAATTTTDPTTTGDTTTTATTTAEPSTTTEEPTTTSETATGAARRFSGADDTSGAETTTEEPTTTASATTAAPDTTTGATATATTGDATTTAGLSSTTTAALTSTTVVTTTAVRTTTPAPTTTSSSPATTTAAPSASNHTIPPLYTQACTVYNTAANYLGVFKPMGITNTGNSGGGSSSGGGSGGGSSFSGGSGGGGGVATTTAPGAATLDTTTATTTATTTTRAPVTTAAPNNNGIPEATLDALRRSPHIAVRLSTARQAIVTTFEHTFMVTVFIRGTQEARDALIDNWNGVGPDADLNAFYRDSIGIISATILQEPAQLWGAYDDPINFPPNGMIADVFWESTYVNIMSGEGLSLGWVIIIIMGMFLILFAFIVLYYRRGASKKEISTDLLQGKRTKKKRRRRPKNSFLKANPNWATGFLMPVGNGYEAAYEPEVQPVEEAEEDEESEDDMEKVGVLGAGIGHEHYSVESEANVPESWRLENLKKGLKEGIRKHQRNVDILKELEKQRERDEEWKRPFQGDEEPILNHHIHRNRRNKLNENNDLFGNANNNTTALGTSGYRTNNGEEHLAGDEEMHEYSASGGGGGGEDGYPDNGTYSPPRVPSAGAANAGSRNHATFHHGYQVTEEEVTQPNPFEWSMQPLVETLRIDDSFRLPPLRNPDGSIIPRRREEDEDDEADMYEIMMTGNGKNKKGKGGKKEAALKKKRRQRFGGIEFDDGDGGGGDGDDDDYGDGGGDDDYNFELPPEMDEADDGSAQRKAEADQAAQAARTFQDIATSKLGLAARRRMHELRDVQQQVVNITALSNRGLAAKKETYVPFDNKSAFNRIATSKFAFATSLFPNWNESEEEKKRRLEAIGLDEDGNLLPGNEGGDGVMVGEDRLVDPLNVSGDRDDTLSHQSGRSGQSMGQRKGGEGGGGSNSGGQMTRTHSGMSAATMGAQGFGGAVIDSHAVSRMPSLQRGMPMNSITNPFSGIRRTNSIHSNTSATTTTTSTTAAANTTSLLSKPLPRTPQAQGKGPAAVGASAPSNAFDDDPILPSGQGQVPQAGSNRSDNALGTPTVSTLLPRPAPTGKGVGGVLPPLPAAEGAAAPRPAARGLPGIDASEL